MDVLLRELRDGPGGIVAYRDTEFATKAVSIGCAPDQQVQLLGRTVGAQHAVIRGGGRRPSLFCLGGLRATVNGKARASSRLEIGDCVEIGGHQLTIVPAPAGFDLAIELRPNTRIDSSDFEAAFRTDLQQTWLSKRRAAWLLMVLVALFGFVVPLAVLKARRTDRPMPAWVPAWLPTWLPTDAIWSPGPLASGHRQVMGGRCAGCHQTLFARVQDGACHECHKNTHDHVERSRLAQTSLGPAPRCASCHREHDEPTGHLPTGNLVDRSDKLCVDCHANSSHSFGTLNIQAVSGFGRGRHPPFAAHAQLPSAAKDGSGLKFSHSQHLNADRVRRSRDRAPLGCADCHKLSPEGEHFEPTTMATNCSTCHELTFDPDAPDRQLPHGKPRDVARTLQDYFARKLSDPNGAKTPTRERRRLPGHEDENVTCKGSTFTCAMQSAAREAQTQFLRRGCVSCHQVRDTGNKDLVDRFKVVPIHLVHDYFPAARFPHRSHLIQGQVAGDAPCLACHPANSAQAGDLLLPDLPICEGCHSDTPVRNRTRLQCVGCHAYHPHS